MTTPLVLIVAHRRIQTTEAISIVHLAIYNNNENKALSTSRYSARLTHLKWKESDTKVDARLSLSGLADSFAKSISYHE
jgi:hypothetical protein